MLEGECLFRVYFVRGAVFVDYVMHGSLMCGLRACHATRGKKGTPCTEVVDLGASTRVEDAPNSPSDRSLKCADSMVSLMLS